MASSPGTTQYETAIDNSIIRYPAYDRFYSGTTVYNNYISSPYANSFIKPKETMSIKQIKDFINLLKNKLKINTELIVYKGDIKIKIDYSSLNFNNIIEKSKLILNKF